MIPAEILNPFGVDRRWDTPHPPVSIENWTEYYYLFAFDLSANIGISVHVGRLLSDLSVWRGILYVFLPDGEILAHKCAGRDGHARGPGAGPFRATCVEPLRLWTLDFDGVLQRTDRTSLSNGILTDGLDELVSFHITLEAASPFFSAVRPTSDAATTWTHHHHEQICRARGEMMVQSTHYDFEGMGVRDHSSGPRSSADVMGAYWANVLFPVTGRTAHVLLLSRESGDLNTSFLGSKTTKAGYVYWGDGSPLEIVEELECPSVCDENTPLRSVPRDVLMNDRLRKFTMVLETSRGPQTMEAERIHAVSTTYVPPSEEIGGTDVNRVDALQQSKTVMRVTWDGEVGYGQSDNLTAMRYLEVD
ncbi:MAG: DUF7065 domain-containing protein [Acidimicrobiales bacterium]